MLQVHVYDFMHSVGCFVSNNNNMAMLLDINGRSDTVKAAVHSMQHFEPTDIKGVLQSFFLSSRIRTLSHAEKSHA